MMTDLISRQAAYETLTKYYHHRTYLQHEALKEALDRVPSVETVPSVTTATDLPPVVYAEQKKSKWDYTYDPANDLWEHTCSECGWVLQSDTEFSGYNYCPNCGARMTE